MLSGNETAKRIFDSSLVIMSLPVLFFIVLAVAFSVRITSPGPVLYWSQRVGRGNALFQMPKFRSMRTDTPAVATHLLDNPVIVP